MDIALSVVIDVILVAVMVFFIYLGVRKGLLKSVIAFGGSIIAVIISVIFASSIGVYINDNYVKEPIRQWMVNQLTSQPEDVQSSDEEVDFESLFKDEPEFFTQFCQYLNVKTDTLETVYKNNLSDGIASAKSSVIDAMATPLSASVSRVIAFTLLFCASWIVIAIIRLVISLLVNVPVVRRFDKLGGAIFGLLSGVIVALVIVAALHTASPYVMKDRSLARKDAIFERTVVYKTLNALNPFVDSISE